MRDSWPLETLASAHVTLIGAGSIGSAIAHALAAYGLGHLTLVDSDRLAWHNLVRHNNSARQVARLKVRVLAEEITRGCCRAGGARDGEAAGRVHGPL